MKRRSDMATPLPPLTSELYYPAGSERLPRKRVWKKIEELSFNEADPGESCEWKIEYIIVQLRGVQTRLEDAGWINLKLGSKDDSLDYEVWGERLETDREYEARKRKIEELL